MEEPQVETSARRPRWHRLRVGTIIGAGALVASLLGWHQYSDNNERIDGITATAHTIAEHRNKCTIAGIVPTKAVGGFALEVTIGLTSGPKPEVSNEYDTFGMDVEFRDGTGNLESGVAIKNETGSTRYPKVLSSRPNDVDGPDGPINVGTLSQPTLTPGPATYTVYRLNTVRTSVEGPLVTNTYLSVAGLVLCGQFDYDFNPQLSGVPR